MAGQAPQNHLAVGRAEYVREMFAGIADRYDLLNSVLSFNRHHAWRRMAVKLSDLKPGNSVLDVCTGTADLAVEFWKAVKTTGTVMGADFCVPMLSLGRKKTVRASGSAIRLLAADALRLPFRDCSFDCAAVAFGIRNVSDVAEAFKEMARVVRPGGRIVCLEFNKPVNRLANAVVGFYQLRILPRIGGMIGRSEAYNYLPESIQAFYTREELTSMMESAGLRDILVKDLNLGSVCIHVGTKR